MDGKNRNLVRLLEDQIRCSTNTRYIKSEMAHLEQSRQWLVYDSVCSYLDKKYVHCAIPLCASYDRLGMHKEEVHQFFCRTHNLDRRSGRFCYIGYIVSSYHFFLVTLLAIHNLFHLWIIRCFKIIRTAASVRVIGLCAHTLPLPQVTGWAFGHPG